MSDFPALATKLVNSTFAQFRKKLQIYTVDGSCENGLGIDITRTYNVGKSTGTKSVPIEDFNFVIVTDVAQWTKKPDVGNIDVTFDSKDLKIIEVVEDAASAAYFLKCKTYERKTVVIQSVTETADGQGGYTSAWSTFANVEAEANYMEGSEAIDAGRLANNQMIKLRFRYVAGITEKMRVALNGETMPIRSVIDFELRNQWIELAVERLVAS